MFRAWQGDAGGVMYSRFATHDMHRARLKDDGSVESEYEEVKLKGGKADTMAYLKGDKAEKPASYFNNYGMNLALGGLGNSFGDSGDVIDDQGRFGHMYQRVKKGDQKTCGAILLGIENSAPTGVLGIEKKFGGYDGVSSVGEKHDKKAISHSSSAFYSTREVPGQLYGGRFVDLSKLTATEYKDVMEKFSQKYVSLQNEISKVNEATNKKGKEKAENTCAKYKAEMESLNELLTGRAMRCASSGWRRRQNSGEPPWARP